MTCQNDNQFSGYACQVESSPPIVERFNPARIPKMLLFEFNLTESMLCALMTVTRAKKNSTSKERDLLGMLNNEEVNLI